MTRSLPSLAARQVIAALRKVGFVEHHQRGSHLHLRHRDRGTLITVPVHAGDLKRGTLRAILKQAGVSIAEFRELL